MVRTRRSSGSDNGGVGVKTRRRRSSTPRKTTARSVKSRDSRYEERSMPPVLIRGLDMTTFPWQVKPRGKAKPRRRYDVALNMPGVEMRLPSLPQVAVGWRMVSFLLVAALGTLLYHLWSAPEYHVEAAQVVGVQRLRSQDVNAVIDVQGESIFTVDTAALEKELHQAFPEFSSVDVKVSLPGDVMVTVDERQPILAWRQDGRTTLVDANGVSFPIRDQNAPVPAVMVDAHGSPPVQPVGEETDPLEQFLPVEMVSAILSMSAQAPTNIPLTYDPVRGLGWQDAQGWEVYFGDTRFMDMKLRVYKAILEKLDDEDTMPALISVEHVHLPYYRLER
jgi:cell division protein FtsQ